jgi:uncharacterized membrane protein
MAEALLFLHLLAALTFVGGIFVAAASHRAARTRSRASEVAALLGVARTGAAAVAIGGVLVLVFGLLLVDLRGHSFGETWIGAALALYVFAMAAGALGGRRPRRARALASKSAEADRPVSVELRRLLDDRATGLANLAAAAAVVAILALMVWQPQ